jgi:sulfhydrogenase subunit beta (sulfur reductase)
MNESALPPTTPADPRMPGSRWILARSDFPRFLAGLERAGYRIVGPTVRDGAIVYGPIHAEADLPIGWTDEQQAGSYRLTRRSDGALFGFTVGPHSWKKYLFPPRERLFTAHKDPSAFQIENEPRDDRPTAYLGVRACEIAAIGIQDRVFVGGAAVDPGYADRRSKVLMVAVQCGEAGGTCFCASMGTGPAVRDGFDLSLTELLSAGRHEFLIEVGTAPGARVVSELPLRPAVPEDLDRAAARVAHAERTMGRRLDVVGIRDLLLGRLEHGEWEKVGKRCLACTNCTMACPTCFCHSTEEVPDLTGTRVERWRRWDSCFNLGYSEVHGGSVRPTIPNRYRQWLTHKLATWYDQFGSSGCVGCGRCITWCPVGIDLTEEVEALRAVPTPVPVPAGSAPAVASPKGGGP